MISPAPRPPIVFSRNNTSANCSTVRQLTVEVVHQKKRFLVRTQVRGTCGRVFQSVGVALPPTVRQIERNLTP